MEGHTKSHTTLSYRGNFDVKMSLSSKSQNLKIVRNIS